MRKVVLRSLIAGTAFVLAFSLVPVSALAHEGEEAEDSPLMQNEEQRGEEAEDSPLLQNETHKDRGDKLRERIQEFRKERKTDRKHRLAANKLAACERRKSKIASIMNRAVTRADRQIKLFSSITVRVKTFYTEKGLSLENYNELVAAVDGAKADAEASLEVLKGMEPFACDADDPKGDIEVFKLALQSVREDLKDYRTAAKNLIVGVKSVVSKPDDEGGES